MATSEFIFVDQENQVPEDGRRGGLAPKRGKIAAGAEAGSSNLMRPVLGELCQNLTARTAAHRLPAKPQVAGAALLIFVAVLYFGANSNPSLPPPSSPLYADILHTLLLNTAFSFLFIFLI
jgi:hypothetical protein